MPKYMISVHHPTSFNPEVDEDETIHQAIDALNDEMVAAGARVFANGLHNIHEAKSLTAQPNGEVAVADGPYLKTDEHVGGFWIIEAANMDEAVEWGRKAVIACRTPIEVRQFHGN